MNHTQTTVPSIFLTPEQAAVVRRKFRDESVTKSGVKLTLIGGWQDLAGYYAGSDGNVYSLQSLASYGGDGFRNEGPATEFPAKFRNMRGGLFQ